MNDDRKLAEHLQTMVPDDYQFVGSWADTYAAGILADPQAHIDALVEAGVLKHAGHTSYPDGNGGQVCHLLPLHYQVVQPHIHEWCVCQTTDRAESLLLGCRTCTEVGPLTVPNRLPIEVPS